MINIPARPIVITQTAKKAATSAPAVFASIGRGLGQLWKNKGVQIGAGLASAGIGLGALNSQTSEVTKPLGQFSGAANFGLIIALIVGFFLLVLVMKK